MEMLGKGKNSELVLARLDRGCYQFGMNRLKAAREAKGMTPTQLAKLVGAGQAEIWRLEAWPDGKNGRPMNVRWAQRLAPHLGVSPAELLGVEDASAGEAWPPPDRTEEQPTIGSETGVRGLPEGVMPQIDVTAGMGGGGLTIVNPGVPGRSGMTFAAEHIRDYWRLPGEIVSGLGLRPTDVAIFPVQGDSMADTLAEGDYVFVDTRHRHPSPDGLYALSDSFGGVVVKRLEVQRRARDEEISVRVISDNPKHSSYTVPLSELWVIGRVIRRFGVV